MVAPAPASPAPGAMFHSLVAQMFRKFFLLLSQNLSLCNLHLTTYCFLLEPRRIFLSNSFCHLYILEARGPLSPPWSCVLSRVPSGSLSCPPLLSHVDAPILVSGFWNMTNQISFISKPDFFKCRTPSQFVYSFSCLNSCNIIAPNWVELHHLPNKTASQYGQKNA